MISGKPHLFLDRDGTLIREEHYLRDPALVTLETDVILGLKRFISNGYYLVVISNQSGIGRGFITEADVTAVNSRLAYLLASEGVNISSWHHCPHDPAQKCLCRKPAPGLLYAAEALNPVDWTQSIIIGDKPSDVELGLMHGVRSALITTGYGATYIQWALEMGVPVVNSLSELADVMHLPLP